MIPRRFTAKVAEAELKHARVAIIQEKLALFLYNNEHPSVAPRPAETHQVSTYL